MKSKVIKNLVALLLLAAAVATPAVAHETHRHGHHRSDVDRVIGAIAVGTIITSIVRNNNTVSMEHSRSYPPVTVRYRDPRVVCGVTPYYHGHWVDIVETNCNGEVVRITTRRR